MILISDQKSRFQGKEGEIVKNLNLYLIFPMNIL